jgi:hypothetical protein
MMDRWLRFKEGFVSVWRLLYPTDPMDWYAQVGRIFGCITLVGLWGLIGNCIVSMSKCVVS